jgi:hypothetical protein
VAFPADLDARRAWQEREDAAVVEPPPEPEHTSRDPWPADVVPPKGVRDLDAWATFHGWTVELTYARGPWIGARGIKTVHSICVRCYLPGRVAVATYTAPVGVNRWVYGGALVAGGPVGIYPRCNVTDFREYLEHRGEVEPEWFEVITARVQAAKARAKASAAARPKRASEVHA